MKCFTPLVSIIIPVFNGANYLKEALDSALAQTYKNIEIIVVNDGSNDNGETERIALSYGDRVRYFSKPNGGTSTALNLGVREMKGEYFSWLSHDDMYYNNKIETQVNELAMLEDKHTIMMSDLDGINEDYEKIYQTNYVEHIRSYPPREQSKIHPVIYNQTHGCTLLIPRICFDKVGMFDETELVAQDFEFFYRAFLVFPHKLIPKVLVTARDSSNRQGRRSKEKGNIEYSRLFIRIIENLTNEDIILLAPSRIEFYSDMRRFFIDAEYSIALEYIESKMIKSLQISSYDLMGRRFNGHDLHLYLRDEGFDSKQLVMNKQSKDEHTFVYNFEAVNSSKDLLRQKVLLDSDIIHLHLTHNIIDVNYFPILSRVKPVVITLHDPFYLGGHCVHHFDCEKWQSHCYDCEHLDKDFRIFDDYSALNFAIKKDAIQNSQISAIVASEWMRSKVEKSAIWKNKDTYLLPFGVNQELFKPADTSLVRQALNVPKDNIVLFFRASSCCFKGLDILIDSLSQLIDTKNISLITVGEKGLLGGLISKFHHLEYDWITDDSLMIQLYQSCNIFLMPSKQETFGFMAVEAMSCGKMVLALDSEGSALSDVINSPYCGLAVKEADFAQELAMLIKNKCEVLDRGNRCLDYALEHYSKQKYVKGIMEIYKSVIKSHSKSDDCELLLQQLKTYSVDNTNMSFINSIVDNAVYNKNECWKVKNLLKLLIRGSARIAWSVVTFLGLKRFVKSTGFYLSLRNRGIVDKLRG